MTILEIVLSLMLTASLLLRLRRRVPAREVTLTNDAYNQWLRAQRPPLPWFLDQPPDHQEAMAILGDVHARDLALGIGYAVADPQLAEAGSDASQDAEETLVKKLAAAAASKLLAASKSAPAGAPDDAPPSSMGGMRWQERVRRGGRGVASPTSFLGKAPKAGP